MKELTERERLWKDLKEIQASMQLEGGYLSDLQLLEILEEHLATNRHGKLKALIQKAKDEGRPEFDVIKEAMDRGEF